MKYVSYLGFLFAFLISCKQQNKEVAPVSSNSIFNLQSKWQNQNGDVLKLENLQGKTLVVVMIYTSCKVACPLLVANMKSIETKIKKKYLDKVSLVLVSIDPETDTPERLKQFAHINNMEAAQWIFLRGDVNATQEFANVLSMKYKKISPVDFSHSNIISIFSAGGQLVSQEQGVGIDVAKVAATVNETVEKQKG